MLLQIIRCAYAHGIVSSRGIARACREHVTFIALCGDTALHVTTIAHFLSTPDNESAKMATGKGVVQGYTLLYIANALVDQHIGLDETDDGIWAIFFNTVLIATVDERDYIIRG